MVAIQYAPGDLRVMGVCDGPDENGCCPLVMLGEEVPCWGLDIVLSKDDEHRLDGGIWRERLGVVPGSMTCPLAKAPLVTPYGCYFSPFACLESRRTA